ncbi:MAG: TIGR03905 family TSCPD domain-containing protein [Fusobacteriaceae bacterium]
MITKKTVGVCAKEISYKLEDGVITAIKFHGGCDGNTTGLENLLTGLSKESVISKLKGIDCRGKGTSCPDQLAKLLSEEN